MRLQQSQDQTGPAQRYHHLTPFSLAHVSFYIDHLLMGYIGDVSTLCEIQSPTSVAITANQIILVATDTHTLHKVTYKGIPTKYIRHNHTMLIFSQDHKSILWRPSRDLGEQ